MSVVSRVRIRHSPETDSVDAAGRTGIIVGETRPSVVGVSVVGGAPDDFAFAVSLDDGETLWFRPDLLEVIGSERVKIEFGRSEPRVRGGAPNWIRQVLDRLWPQR